MKDKDEILSVLEEENLHIDNMSDTGSFDYYLSKGWIEALSWVLDLDNRFNIVSDKLYKIRRKNDIHRKA